MYLNQSINSTVYRIHVVVSILRSVKDFHAGLPVFSVLPAEAFLAARALNLATPTIFKDQRIAVRAFAHIVILDVLFHKK
jgi:hypothetical protein